MKLPLVPRSRNRCRSRSRRARTSDYDYDYDNDYEAEDSTAGPWIRCSRETSAVPPNPQILYDLPRSRGLASGPILRSGRSRKARALGKGTFPSTNPTLEKSSQ